MKFRIERDRATAAEIFRKIVYGLKDTGNDLGKMFYSHNQETREYIQDYSISLMEILMNMDKLRSSDRRSESKIKDIFADGVHDVALRRQLNRLNMERPTLKFFELRDEARLVQER